MTSEIVISNASPLIALEQIGQLGLLEQLLHSIVVPPAVVREVSPSVNLPVWITERALSQSVGPRILNASLGAGESEAISLAQALSLPIIGTLGVLLAAKQRHFLTAVRPSLDALLELDFRIAPTLYDQILLDAGER
jgi:predicted nucleic acid-binding protein